MPARISVLGILFRWSSACACTAGLASPVDAQRNNVLIIVADDVGVDKVGAYGVGSSPPPTPNVDALAARGLTFRNAWSNPSCSPTRACIQTGRYCFRTGVGQALLSQSGELRYSETTIPELLDAAGSGYTHAAFGKWHLSDARNGGALGPNLAGWSHYAGALDALDNYFRWNYTVNGVATVSTTYNTTRTVDDALAWIGSVPEPWVCYVAFHAAHSPFHNPPAHLHSYSLPGSGAPFLLQYKAMVEAMDTEIGRMLGGLGGQLGRTDVIFMGDNGTPQGIAEPPFPTLRAKHTPYQGGVLVPLIIAGPSVQAPGRDVDAIVGAVDIFSTVTEMCGVDLQPPWVRIDSVSLMPYLQSPGQTPLRSTVLAEDFGGSARTAPFTQFAYRDQQYKLLYVSWRSPQEEFYDLIADPYEGNDLLRGTLTSTESARYQALRAGVNQLRLPLPSITTYGGTTCMGSGGQPTISAHGAACLGSSYTVGLANAAAAMPAVLVIGASRTRFASGISLPYALAALGGGPGCFLYCSTEFMVVTTTNPSGAASVSLTVPNDPVLEQGSLYHTWLASDPGASPLGVTGSNGLVATIGFAKP